MSLQKDAQPFINAQVNVGGQWKQFRAILDSGNDVTLMSQQTAQQLGISPQMAGGKAFKVQFGNTANDAHNFYQVSLPMKLAPHLRPFTAAVGVGQVRENLIGRKDAFQHHDILFKAGGKMQITQSQTNANTFSVQLGNNRERHAAQNANTQYTDVVPNNYL